MKAHRQNPARGKRQQQEVWSREQWLQWSTSDAATAEMTQQILTIEKTLRSTVAQLYHAVISLFANNKKVNFPFCCQHGIGNKIHFKASTSLSKSDAGPYNRQN